MKLRMKAHVLWVLCSVSTLHSVQTNQELFLQANVAYAARDYTKAFELYNTLSDKGPVAWYNMGNCAYQLQRYSDAYVYWKKSEQGASWELLHDAEHNLHLLKNGTSEKTVSFYGQIQHQLYMYLKWSSLWWLQVLVAGIWIIFLLLCVRCASRKLVCMFLLLMSCCGIALKNKYSDMTMKVGIVTQAQTALYAGPNTHFHHIATLDEMTEVKLMHISASRQNWYKISYKNQIGWVPADTVKIV